MKKPEIEVNYVLTDNLTQLTEVYVSIEGDHYVHAYVGKQGELRVNSVRIQEDADIEKNKQELVTTELRVFNARVWRDFANGAI